MRARSFMYWSSDTRLSPLLFARCTVRIFVTFTPWAQAGLEVLQHLQGHRRCSNLYKALEKTMKSEVEWTAAVDNTAHQQHSPRLWHSSYPSTCATSARCWRHWRFLSCKRHNCDRLWDAHSLLRRLPLHPFSENPLYHGYAGVYEARLADISSTELCRNPCHNVHKIHACTLKEALST